MYGQPPVSDVLARGENPLAAVSSTLAAADVAVVNLETAIVKSAPEDFAANAKYIRGVLKEKKPA